MKIAVPLLRWYDAHARVLPWRAKKGKRPNPYHVLLSEFMLQQTTVTTVKPYFATFLKRWPALQTLAAADLEEIRAAWAGLGYYRRARFLHAAARAIVKEHGGKIPQDEATLLTIPGIGPYTAAAIATIAYDVPANVVDGNVLRVMARLYAVKEPLPQSAPRLKKYAALHVPQKRAGDYAQALMDLGATICTPRNPNCPACPLRKICKAYQTGAPASYPRKIPKKKTPSRFAAIFVVQDKEGRVLLRKRAEQGLLGGMWEFPSTPWADERPSMKLIQHHRPKASAWAQNNAPVIHVFSHFKLHLDVHIGHSPSIIAAQDEAYVWKKAQLLSKMALPSVMRKVAKAAKVVGSE
jgi:A/G-specific adenine glycosylase